MNTCPKFIPGAWKPNQCQECFQNKEKHLMSQTSIPTPTPKPKPKPKPKPMQTPTTPTVTATSTPTITATPTPIIFSIDEDKLNQEHEQRLRNISITSDDSQSNIHLCTIIGVETDTIPELERLEIVLEGLQKQLCNKYSLQNSIDAMINILDNLCKNNYNFFKKIDMEKRKMFFESIYNRLRHMKEDFEQILSAQQWKALREQLSLLKKLCTFNFNEKPLMFAKQAVKHINILKKSEDELIGLIDKMRREYPTLLDDILDTEYRQIKNTHREKIVITVLGSTKSSKSSLINFLLQREICPTGNKETTARLTKITYAQQIRLRSSTTNSSEPIIFNGTKGLLQEAKKLIILEKDERKSELCNDEIVIELPIEELENVELWDIPGFDENEIINERIKEILKDTDLILAVIPHRESLRQTAIDFIKPCLEQNDLTNNKNKSERITKICFIISQIDTYRPDGQSNETKDSHLQHMYDKIQQELNINFRDADYKLSSQFIPMCSSHIHSLKDYLTCREQFIEKSYQWFTDALRDKTYRRSNTLLKAIGTFWNYDDIFRQQTRYQYMNRILNERFPIFTEELTKYVKKKLEEVYLHIKQSIDGIVKECLGFYKKGEQTEKIEEHIQNELIRKFNELLKDEKPEIERMISKMFKNFSTAIELTAPQMRNLKEVLDEVFTDNSYESTITQYEHTSPYHLFTYLKGMLYVLSSKLTAVLRSERGDDEIFREEFVLPQKYVEQETMKSITNLVNAVLRIIFNNLSDKVEETFGKFLSEQLEQLHKKIEENVNKYMRSSANDQKIGFIRKFYTENSTEIRRMHLNTLDIQFNLDYTVDINENERLDKDCNFRVFTGTLKETKSRMLKETKSCVAAKLIKLADFKIQEVLYIRELKHENVISYYGVKRKTKDQYYIIMPRLDCDLATYLKEYSKELTNDAIDQMITQIIKGLDYIHTELELIHRDIKLQNILVNKAKMLFLISDLGGIHREPLTCIYTKSYGAPELFSNENPTLITEKCDIFSLGIVIQTIIRLSKVKYLDDTLIRWANIAKECCLVEPSARPSCKKILEMRSAHIEGEAIENKSIR